MSDHEEPLSADLLRLVVVRDGVDVTVFVEGHLDVASGWRLRDRVEDLLTTRSVSVTIDASGVTFVDSSGFAALLSARHSVMTEAGIALRLANPSPALQKIAEVTGFEKLLSEE
jgi:anti-anti-sigma factor